MNRFALIFCMTLVSFVLSAQSSFAGSFIYSKPEFRGRVIDAETKEPIEGVVAVVLYYKQFLMGAPGGPHSYVTKARETLTDHKGDFFFPSYCEIILFTNDIGISFIFFKPGYMSGDVPTYIHPYLTEKYFSAGKVGEELEIKEATLGEGNYAKWKGPIGMVELKRAKTYEDRRITRPSIDGVEKNQLPIFF